MTANPLNIRPWLRNRFDDSQRFLLLCILSGLFCGLAAVGLHISIHYTFESLWGWASSMPKWQFIGIMLAAPTLAGLVIGISTQTFAPSIVGSGIPQTKVAFYNHSGKIPIITALWRFILTTIYCGLGNSLGREGPTIHMATAISSKLSRIIFISQSRIQSSVPVGMAAGIAAAFNAPLSAITFVFEELLDNFSMKALGGIVIAVVIASAVSRSILGDAPILSSSLDLHFHTSVWMIVAIPLGVAAGLLGHLFVVSVLRCREFFTHQIPYLKWLHPAFGGLTCGILGLSALYLTEMFGDPQKSIFSIGYESLELAFEAQLAIEVIGILLVFKFIAVVLNYATGGSGGLFSPTLFLGALLGALLGILLSLIHHHLISIHGFPSDAKVIGGCTLLGMGAMFSSVIRCPFTSLIIIFEITGNCSLILPLMAGNMLAWSLSKRWSPTPLYDALLIQDEISLRKFSAYKGAKDYRSLPISSIMTYETINLKGDDMVSCYLAKMDEVAYHFHGFPVLNEDDLLLGLVTHHEIEDADPDIQIRELVAEQKTITVTPDTSIRDAANLMIAKDIQQLPVVSNANSQRLIGIITLNDIARQQNSEPE